MATFVLKDVTHWVDEFDLSPDFRSATLNIKREPKDNTAWGATTRTSKGGLWVVTFAGEGFYQADDSGAGLVDDTLSTKLAVEDSVVTVTPEGAADTKIGWSFEALETEYAPMTAPLGELAAFVTASVGSGDWFRGTIILPKLARTTTSNGTSAQLGAVLAAEKVYASLHVFAASGSSPTLDVIVKSDDNSGMSSSTSRITFAQKIATGSEMLSTAGAITDDWWRIDFTIGGGGPSFTFAVMVGIR